MKIVHIWKFLVLLPVFYCHKMVSYWGQNGVSSAVQSPSDYEKSLLYYCNMMKYDILAIGFLHVFFDSKNKDKFPSINLSYHCETFFDDYPTLLHCPTLANEIIECQKKNIKVIMSLGGAAGNYGFKSVDEAQLLAQRVWDLLLGGDSKTRPFNQAILDGVDLDIEGAGPEYYTDFVKKLRSLMNADTRKKYLLTAAPQCPYPDARLGPGASGTVLTDIGEEFDHIYVQFYNNYCDPGRGFFNIDLWFGYAKNVNATKSKGPKIFLGLPAGERASGHPIFYQSPTNMERLYKEKLSSNPYFGGIMIWDSGFDGNNINNGLSYSDRLTNFMQRDTFKPTVEPITKYIPTITSATTSTTSITISTTSVPITTTPPATSTELIPVTKTIKTSTAKISSSTILTSPAATTLKATTKEVTTAVVTRATEVTQPTITPTTTENSILTILTEAKKKQTTPTEASSTLASTQLYQNGKPGKQEGNILSPKNAELMETLVIVCVALLTALIILVLIIILLVCRLLTWKRLYILKDKDSEGIEISPYSNISELNHEIKYYQPSI